MRLFTGIAIPEEIKATLARLLDHLRPHAHLKWCAAYNLHITTKFIGEWPEERLPEIISALKNIPVPPAFDIDIRGLGWFPNPHSPRTLWAAIHTTDSLRQLAQDTDSALAALGISPETRPFSPHLTLARVKEPTPLAALRQAIAALTSVDFGKFRANSFALYVSKPGPSSSIYTQLAEFPLRLQ